MAAAEQREEEARVEVEVEREEPVPEKAPETLEVGPALPESPAAAVAPTIHPPSNRPLQKGAPQIPEPDALLSNNSPEDNHKRCNE